MKKLKNISLVALFLFTFSFAGAKEKDGEGVSLNGEQTVLVDLSNVNRGTRILFEDKFGVTLFKDDLLKDGQYNKSLHLEMIPHGIYFLKVDKRFATRVWKIKKSSKGVEIVGKSATISKPHFRVQQERVGVFMTNTQEGRVDLSVEDKHGEVLAQIRESGKLFQKILDFSNVPSGEYLIKVNKGQEKFEEKIVIN
ncbi:T9SS type A sorting domain-containing protein [Salinimicrobium sediminilitoris]|uniref:T9SS type A sorting domain-containing protein n=1 Tax=Salinimicrobium sediminilitoris TaxID=2876715 RepID=UPI001E3A2F8B|nr:T9SS type A sorting domain-containing protein [Salinimicrobium sediminilitoris]MCC8360349.1 T9SS type A sorting domain-containing protein [Salinimicrobium sediminilitoris]